MDELVKDMQKVDAMDVSSDDYLLMNSKYIPLNIESKNFHGIHAKKGEERLLFVDGGNSVLFDSASFSIGVVRVGAIWYSNNVRVSRRSKEFYAFIRIRNNISSPINNAINNTEYLVSTYPKTSFDGLSFNPEDESLKDGIEKCSPSRILSVVRRLAEIEMAYENSDKTGLIVMDGTLEARYPSESRYLDKLMSTGMVCALSKTCNLVTKNGEGIIRKLSGMGKELDHPWYYYPIVQNKNPSHRSEIYFVKLNANSEYTFRFEIQQGFKGDIEETLGLIAANSNDPVFLGYPYGLLDVDQYARISDEESTLMQTKLSVKMGKHWNKFSKNLTSTNAHAILDKIKF